MKNKSRLYVFSMQIFMIRSFPLFVIGELLSTILNALTAYIGNVLFLRYIVSAMIERNPISELFIVLAFFAIYQICAEIYSAVYKNIWRPRICERIEKRFYYEFKKTAQNQALYVYDNPSFYDDMTYVSSHITGEAIASVSYISKIISNIINIALIIGVFSQIGATVSSIICASIVISLLFNIPIVRLNNEKKYLSNSINRKKKYFYNCFFSRNSFMDRKITNIDAILNGKYLDSVKEQKTCNKKYGLKIFVLSALKDGLASNILLNLILFVYLLYETLVTHNLHGGDFIAAYNGVNIVVGSIMELVSVWESMRSSSYTIEKYNFIKSQVDDIESINKNANYSEKINEIILRNVSFVYPGTEKRVLDNVNMCLSVGDKVAIVGKNGSGKTTLVHLLMGLYKPTDGEIMINGKPIKNEEYPLYRNQFAAFFQGMIPFEASIAENVALDTETDLERVKIALSKTKSEKLITMSPNNMIGVLFDKTGAILSGGEFQKLMLSYCFYSDKSLIVMDEPSSALDPIAERDFNIQVGSLSENKLAVFVTHRLSTVHMANRIFVIDDGKICGCGTHSELMEQKGIYKEMWTIQEKKYSLNAVE